MIPLGVLASARAAASGFTTITDSFNRADSATTLGSADTGQAWSGTGTWGIVSNGARVVATNDSYQTVESGIADGYKVSVTLTGTTYQRWPGIVFRFTDASNLYWLESASGSDLTLFRRMSGSKSALSSYAGGFGYIQPGDSISVTVTDEGGSTRIICHGKGVQRISYLDSTSGRPAGTRVGLRGQTSAYAQFDDFAVEAS